MVHTMFRREFALLGDLVERVAAGDTARAKLVTDHIELIDSMLHHHHSSEDVHLWPRIRDRGPARAGRRRVQGHPRRRPPTAGAGAVRAHGHRGDAGAVPDRAVRHRPGMGRMVQEGASGIAAEQFPLLFGFMMYEGDPEIIEVALASMPPEVRLATEELARKLYAEHSQRVHGTPTPRRAVPRTDAPPVGTSPPHAVGTTAGANPPPPTPRSCAGRSRRHRADRSRPPCRPRPGPRGPAPC